MATTYPKIPAYPNILNGGTGATSIEVTSTDNTVTQNGASSFNPTTKALTVDLSADKIPSYDEYADLPDPTTVELRSYAAVNQTTQIGGQLQTAGIYNILTVGGVEGQYWSFLGEYPDNITIKYGNEVLYVNTGTSANQILQLDGEAKVPAVDASQTTVGTVVPTNAIVSDNDSINTSVNKLQGQIDNALKPLSPAVNNNIVTTTSTGTLKDSGFNINNSLPYSNPLPTEVADALSTYNYMISLANATNGLPAVLLYFDTNQTLSGLPTQGDYTCVDNDRVILTNQTNPAENLIYNVHSGAWTIAPDSTKVNQLLGAYTEIIKGTYSISWTYLVSISPSSGDFVPTSVTWSVPIPSGLYQAGAGLSLTGSVFSVADNGVTNAKLAQSGANTYKGNNTGALANVQDVATNTAFNKNFETSTTNIKMDGIVSVGSSGNVVNSDHVHPSDTSKQNIISTPTTDDIVSVNSLGQVIDSGKAFSLDTSLSANSTNKVPVESVLKYNIDYVNNRINNLPIGAGSGTVYYFTNDAIGSYFTLATLPKNGTQAQLQATVNNNSVLLGAFQTTSQLNRTLIDAGIWEFNIWVTSDSTQNTTSVYAEVYKISNTNVETLLFTINNSSNIGSTSIIQYSISDTQPSYVVALTDKLIIKLYAKTTRTQDTIVTVYYNSQQYYSHAHTPLIAKHNQLSGLNGGNGADEYYHLTNSQYNNVINQASNLQNGYLSSTDWTTFNNKQNSLTNPVTSSSVSATNNQLAVFNGTGNQVSPQTTLPAAAFPALTGDVTTTSGSLNTTISNNAVTNAKLNTMATNTIKANITGSTANPQDITIAQLNTSLSVNTNTQYVTPLGSDTNNGYTPSTGVATLGQALTNLGNVAGIIFISPKVGGYSGDYTITSQNINIVSLSPNQAVDFNGTLTFSHTASNVQLNNISCEILNHTGAGAVYMFGGSVTTSLTSSGNGYLYTSGVDLQATATTVSITGAKSVVFTNATVLGQLTINNPSAIVSLLNCLNSKAITLTSGVLGINNSTIYSASAGANAISVSPEAFFFATNSTFLVTNTTTPALINVDAGSVYSISNCAYSDSSVIAGTMLTRTGKFDAIALTTALPFASGGTGAKTRQAALNALASTVTTGQYLRGNGTNISMSAIQASDVPTLNQNTTGTASSVTGTNVVTNTNLSTMPTNTLKGNNTGSTANASDLTTTQVTAILNNFVGDSGSGGTKGLVPAPASGDGVANKYLNATGSWSVPAGGNTIESQYIRIKPASGVNTWDANRRMRFSQILNSLGSNITLASTGIVRLVSAGTYELTAVWQGSAGGGGGTIGWYNETSGAFVGQESIICPPDSGNTSTPNSVLYYTITITSPTNFSIRETGNGNMQPNAINSYVIARQLNAPTPTTANDVPTGTIIQNVSPNIGGYLLCNGNNYNRNDYIALFNLLNTEKGTCTIAISTPAVITLTNHELTTGQKVYFTTTGALPTGLTANTTYWVNVLNITTFNLATSYANLIAGIYIATSGTQSGVHTAFLTIASVSNATTFNTPDYQGKVLANADASNGVGKFTGAETHTLTTGELPAHSHGITGDGGSGIGGSTSTDRVLSNTDGTPQNVYVKNTQTAGSGQSHNNMQPTEFVYFHIKY